MTCASDPPVPAGYFLCDGCLHAHELRDQVFDAPEFCGWCIEPTYQQLAGPDVGRGVQEAPEPSDPSELPWRFDPQDWQSVAFRLGWLTQIITWTLREDRKQDPSYLLDEMRAAYKTYRAGLRAVGLDHDA